MGVRHVNRAASHKPKPRLAGSLRRLAAGSKLGFGVGLRGKTGVDLADAKFEVQVVLPANAAAENVTTARERDGERGTFWKTDRPGEYRLSVKATGKDVDNTIISGEATARFLVYQDETEMRVQAMNDVSVGSPAATP